VDLDWMPRLVLIAKSTYVWLDQLSKSYGRDIHRLDQIPDDELDRLARLGFTGLWLIGLWQRSQASQRIKQLRGNAEAVASAYSLDDYRIADDLGGEGAFEDLKARAWARGIRITSDMVPNHMGIDSRWVVEHPDWFIWLPEPAYPAYAFTGPDLSPDGRVQLRIEDHYFDNTDAAVVFQRVDNQTGDVRYLYHGNDGTSMPWNDTAQLDYLRADVREAVIQTILAVARRSPVIRFDAAMTLAKRHIERLWYPEPGHAGGIPSRAEHAMPKAAFEAAMPVEFWREVVDRVAAEVPDTLLLAEAFWLMEGYFVRTLGMHRVYNSAFMNMLRDEQNAQYRAVMRNTLEFEPEVLKRYVNFMNNPDEKTAVEQFGKGDKYFGLATLMATMPGLPMFGHGQIEGYTEKYGMEYRRAYWDERPDPWLVERHEREITPLLQRRAIFAHVDDFLLYDFIADDGSVVEDVFAYSNRGGADRSLVVFHNRYGSASGRIRESVPYAERVGEGAGSDKQLRRRTLADGLGLAVEDGRFAILRDRRSGLEELRATRELADGGLRLDLGAYDCRVFLDIVEVADSPGRPYGRLAAELGGRRVPSVEDAMRRILLRPVQEPVERLLEPAAMEAWRSMAGRRADTRATDAAEGHLRSDLAAHLADLFDAAAGFVGGAQGGATGAERAEARVASGIRRVPAASLEDDADLVALAAHLVTTSLAAGLGHDSRTPAVQQVRTWIDDWGLGGVIAEAFRCAGLDEAASWRAVDAVKALAVVRGAEVPAGAEIVGAWRNDDAAARAVGVNEHRGVRWFNREAFEQAVRWWALAALAAGAPRESVTAMAAQLREAASASGYRLDDLVAVLEGRPLASVSASRLSNPVRPTAGGRQRKDRASR
jgi:glycosidase